MLNIRSLPAWVDGLIDFVFPPMCLGCGSYTEEATSVCANCLDAIDRFNHPFCLKCMDIIPSGLKCPMCKNETVPLFAHGNYTAPLEEIIIHFKFKGIRKPASLFAGLLCDRFGEAIISLKCATLVPIPLHPGRENHRGYNQAEIFAESLAERLVFDVNADILARDKKRKPQARLNQRQRASNIEGVFSVISEAGEDNTLILVDDVVTSGATAREAVKTLKRGGYKVAAVVAIAHAV